MPRPDDDYNPVTPFDVSDDNPQAVSHSVRALQREMRDGFDSLGRSLAALTRIEERLVVIIDRQNHSDRRLDEHERRIAALEGTPVAPPRRALPLRKAKR